MNMIFHGLLGTLVSSGNPWFTLFSFLPDFDGISVLWGMDKFKKIHRGFFHSFFAGAILSILTPAPLFAFLGYSFHILIDYTYGINPVSTFWPFTRRRFLLFQKDGFKIDLLFTVFVLGLLVVFR